jgi:hypothetical protein
MTQAAARLPREDAHPAGSLPPHEAPYCHGCEQEWPCWPLKSREIQAPEFDEIARRHEYEWALRAYEAAQDTLRSLRARFCHEYKRAAVAGASATMTNSAAQRARTAPTMATSGLSRRCRRGAHTIRYVATATSATASVSARPTVRILARPHGWPRQAVHRRVDDDLVMAFLAGGDLVVVETDDDCYLGAAEVNGDQLVIRAGFVGRPELVPIDAVRRVTPASEHEDVVDAGDGRN